MTIQYIKFSALPAATTPINGNEILAIDQGGITKQVAAQFLGRNNASYLLLSDDGFLTNNRVLTAGANIHFADNGPHGSLVMSADFTSSLAAPTGLIGLTPVVGVLNTLVRSDSSAAIDQGISPNWTSAHKWVTAGSAGNPNLALDNSSPIIRFTETDQGADSKVWRLSVNAGVMSFGSLTDAFGSVKNWAAATRTANAISNVAFGNATDNSTFTFLGNGAIGLTSPISLTGDSGITGQVMTSAGPGSPPTWNTPGGGGITFGTPTALVGLVPIAGVGVAAIRSDASPALNTAINPTWTGNHIWSNTNPVSTWQESDQSADEQNWSRSINGKVLTEAAWNAGFSQFRNWVQVTRGTGPAISDISFGNTTNNPTYNFVGTGALTASGSAVIGNSVPVGLVNLSPGSFNVGSSSTGMIAMYRYNNAGHIDLYRTNGTPGAETPVLSGDMVGAVRFSGSRDSGTFYSGSELQGLATENWGIGARGTKTRIQGTAIGGTTLLDLASLAPEALTFGNATSNPTYTFAGSGAISGVGSGLTALNGSSIASGTVADARLSANVPLLTQASWEKTVSLNGTNYSRITNANAGTAAFALIELNNGTRGLQLLIQGANVNPSIYTGAPTGAAGILGVDGNIPLSIGTNGTERIRLAGDGSVINLKSTSVQTNGVDITAVTGNFTATLTGFTVNPTGTVNYRIIGKIAYLWTTASITGTSNSGALSLTGLPSILQPSSNHTVLAMFFADAGTSNNPAFGTAAFTAASGTVVFGEMTPTGTSTSTFGTSGTKGLSNAWNTCYPLD